MNGKQTKLSRYETFKINVKAHLECMPVIIRGYFRRLRRFLGI